MASIILTAKYRKKDGKKRTCMRQFGLSKRITRCRNWRGGNNARCIRLEDAHCESNPTQQTCEVTFDLGVSKAQRAYVLSQADLYCRMCGAAPGDIDDLTECEVTFHVGLNTDGKSADEGEFPNLRALCSTCNQGTKNITTVKPPAIWLLSQIRRAGQEEQLAVLEWLLKKFKK